MERLTDSAIAKALNEVNPTDKHNQCYIYLAELEDKLESGQLVDTTPYIVEIKNEIPFKYKVIKPTVHRRNVEMCGSRESAERCVNKLEIKRKAQAEARLKELRGKGQ